MRRQGAVLVFSLAALLAGSPLLAAGPPPQRRGACAWRVRSALPPR